jgi:hypothetical protein
VTDMLDCHPFFPLKFLFFNPLFLSHTPR